MISIGKIMSVEQAARYLREAIADSQIDYYTGRGEAPGRWAGEGARSLDLHGEVTDRVFRAVLAGVDPRTGEDLGRRYSSSKLVAFDVTVSAPKDMTLLYALGDWEMRTRILGIHAAGVREAAAYLEEHAAWARQYDPVTKGVAVVPARMVMPEFVHRTARPVTDPATGITTIDPQLHTHIPIPTWVQRPDGSWGQLYSEPLYDHAATAGAIAQAVWRDLLVRELGVTTEVDPTGCFRIAGITEVQRREFSRRTLQIEAAERMLGVDSLLGHKVAVADTRESKHEVEAGADVFGEWRRRAAAVGLDDGTVRGLMGRELRSLEPRTLDVDWPSRMLGVDGLTAESATFSRRDVIRLVAAHAPLGMSREQLEATADAILADSRHVVAMVPPALAGETDSEAMSRWASAGIDLRYSTAEMVAIEREMLATARNRADAGAGVADPAAVATVIAARPTLTGGQRAMIEAICLDRAGVIVVEGAAGVGKTFAADACREAFAASEVRIIGCTLAGRAAEGLEEESGIPTWTVAALLHELEQDRLAPDSVLLCDEAGMVGSRQLAELVALTDRDDAKLVLIGDPRQLQPIDAGAGFRALGEHLGRLEVTENLRQREAWERAALGLLREGQGRQALAAYIGEDRLHSATNAWERQQQIVLDYTAAAGDGLDVVMLVRRRDDVTALNALARATAGQVGRVDGPVLTVGDSDFQRGDPVVCLANRRSAGLTNGLRGEVIAVDAERGLLTVRTTAGRDLDIDTNQYQDLAHAYALTVHKGQGLTADVGLVVGSEGASREWTYTAMSRGRQRTVYYEVDRPRERDRLGTGHWQEPTPPLADRVGCSWERSAEKDATLDYPNRYAAGVDERRLAALAAPTGLCERERGDDGAVWEPRQRGLIAPDDNLYPNTQEFAVTIEP